MSYRWSKRGRMVADWFGVHPADLRRSNRTETRNRPAMIELAAGRVVAISGPSGAGKSRLLSSIKTECRQTHDWTDLDATVLPEAMAVDVMARAMHAGCDQAGVAAALEALSRAGLGEVWTYLRRPGQLSEGQRWRLRLAVALAQCRRSIARTGRVCVLAADEFGARLDRISAVIAGRMLRKCVNHTSGLCAVIASAREEAPRWVEADEVIACDYGVRSRQST